MANEINIFKAKKDDISAIEILYKESFPEEDLLPLVVELLNDEQNTINLSAFIDGKIAGHIAFSKCHVNSSVEPVYLLGPLAVLPDYQRLGVGSSLIREGVEVVKGHGALKVLALGDPNFYKRFGFSVETEIQPAYSIPKEWEAAWQSCEILGCGKELEGRLEVPKAWQKKELWS